MRVNKKTISLGIASVIVMGLVALWLHKSSKKVLVPLSRNSHSLHPFDDYPGDGTAELIKFGGCTTVDVGPDDDGFLGCVQDTLGDLNYYKNTPVDIDSPVKQALRNLGKCPITERAIIVGHGQPAFIHASGGNYYVKDRASQIGYIENKEPGPQPWDISEWATIAERDLKNKFSEIILLGLILEEILTETIFLRSGLLARRQL